MLEYELGNHDVNSNVGEIFKFLKEEVIMRKFSRKALALSLCVVLGATGFTGCGDKKMEAVLLREIILQT